MVKKGSKHWDLFHEKKLIARTTLFVDGDMLNEVFRSENGLIYLEKCPPTLIHQHFEGVKKTLKSLNKLIRDIRLGTSVIIIPILFNDLYQIIIEYNKNGVVEEVGLIGETIALTIFYFVFTTHLT